MNKQKNNYIIKNIEGNDKKKILDLFYKNIHLQYSKEYKFIHMVYYINLYDNSHYFIIKDHFTYSFTMLFVKSVQLKCINLYIQMDIAYYINNIYNMNFILKFICVKYYTKKQSLYIYLNNIQTIKKINTMRLYKNISFI